MTNVKCMTRAAWLSLLMLAMRPTGAQTAELSASEININTTVSSVNAVSIPGSTSTSRVLFVRRTRERPALEATVEVGVVRICGGGRVSNSSINVNAVVDGVIAVGSTVRIANVYVCP